MAKNEQQTVPGKRKVPMQAARIAARVEREAPPEPVYVDGVHPLNPGHAQLEQMRAGAKLKALSRPKLRGT